MNSRLRTLTKEFICLYRDSPCLWKIKSNEYRNRSKRNAAFALLIDKLKEIEPSANKELVLKKINNLRSSYRKEAKKVKRSMKMRGDDEDIYQPKLWYFDLLSFLNNQDQDIPRYSRSNLDSDEECDVHARGAALNKQQKQIYGAQQETMQDAQCSQVNRLELDDSNQDPLAAVIEDSNDTEGFENDWYDNNDGAKAEDEMNIEEPQMQEEGTAVNTRASPLPVGAFLSQSPQPTHPTIGLDNTRKSSLKRKRGLEDDDLKVLDNALKLLQSSTDVSHDPYYTYGLHIANELRKYDSQTLAHVKRAFADIMFKADMGQLFDSNPQYSRRFVPHNSPRTSSHPQEQNGCTSPEIKRIFLPVPSELDQDIILP